MPKVKAKARVQVTIDIVANSSWGSDCPIDQIHKQAKEDVLDELSRDLKNGSFTIIGNPKVIAVITEEC